MNVGEIGRPIVILLVEDNPGDARVIEEMLVKASSAPLDVECADRLSTGLERLSAGGIDVVLLDLSLPDSTGFDTFVELHDQASQVPIIVFTGFDDEALGVEAVREGAQDYLVKGQVDSYLLVRAVRYAIERKRVEVERERLIGELQEALAEIKTLRGIVPICASCKKIRDDQGHWHQVEVYVRDHTEAQFSHGMCPECAKTARTLSGLN